MTSERLYIATRDPRDGGGVASMVRFVYRVADDAGYDPCLVFNMLSDNRQVRLRHPWKYLTTDSTSYDEFEVDGMECRGIPLIFPEVEFLQYVANRYAWENATDDGDIYFAVGGTNHPGIPFLSKQQFGIWVATLLWDDRVDRLKSAPTLERIRDRFSKPILEYLEGRVFEAAEPLYLLSEYTANRVQERYDIDENKETIPFPIDTTTFSPSEEQIQEERENSILFVGRFNDPRKNITMLVQAFAKLLSKHPQSTLRLVGADPNERVREAVVDEGVSEAVEFVGAVPNEELPAYYREADIFVIPSNQEGLAIVGLEAMACGTPVISTRCGGPEQYVDDGDTGYLVPRGDTDALARRLDELLSDSTSLVSMGERAREVIEREYAESVVAERFIEAFDQLSTVSADEE